MLKGKLALLIFSTLLVTLAGCKLVEPVEAIIISSDSGSIGVYQSVVFEVGNIPLAPLDEVEYEWTIGDAPSVEGESVTHVFTQPGFYEILLHIIFKNRAASSSSSIRSQQDHGHDHGSGGGTEWEFKAQVIVQEPQVAIQIDPFNSGSLSPINCPTSGGSPEIELNSSFIFGSRAALITTPMTGTGSLDRNVGATGMWSGFTGSCEGGFSIRYPSAGMGDPMNVSAYRVISIPIDHISGIGEVSVLLGDGSQQHAISHGILDSSKTHLIYPMQEYAFAGINLAQIQELEITIDGAAPLSITLGGNNGFGN